MNKICLAKVISFKYFTIYLYQELLTYNLIELYSAMFKYCKRNNIVIIFGRKGRFRKNEVPEFICAPQMAVAGRSKGAIGRKKQNLRKYPVAAKYVNDIIQYSTRISLKFQNYTVVGRMDKRVV